MAEINEELNMNVIKNKAEIVNDDQKQKNDCNYSYAVI